MNESSRTIVLGTRGSALARWQTDHISAMLRAAWADLTTQIQIISTQGDREQDTPLPVIGGKGVFTADLEAALRDGSIDLAVHSLKDLPTEHPAGLTIGASPQRATPNDALVSRTGHTLDTLPQGATVGTSSRRRAAQLLYRRPDLKPIDIRGNVDTRIRKALDPNGSYDAIVLAAAGLERLGRLDVVTELLPLDVMLPAPGQGVLAVQCRDDAQSRSLLAPLNHESTMVEAAAERAFLAGLGGGCALPIAAYAQVNGQRVRLHGRVSAPDGSEQIDVLLEALADLDSALDLGAELAATALEQGVGRLLESLM